jgi:hypothetical protein
VHCAYHMAGREWFHQVLQLLTDSYALRFQMDPLGLRFPQEDDALEWIRPDTDVAFYAYGGRFRPDLVCNRPFRGTHMVRDPRDLVVSGYEDHKVTADPWAHKPRVRLDGLSHQQYLCSMSEHDGLMVEIQFMAPRTAGPMSAWNYRQPDFLEVRYEDAVADEFAFLERICRWYCLNRKATRIVLEGAEGLSKGRSESGSNYGLPGHWRNRLAPDHIALFKELTGDLVVKLGYEADADW